MDMLHTYTKKFDTFCMIPWSTITRRIKLVKEYDREAEKHGLPLSKNASSKADLFHLLVIFANYGIEIAKEWRSIMSK
jgi:hypothetical protein